jgi:hypothetical protein
VSAWSLVIDRIEDDLAILETADGASYTLSAGLLPEGSREGSWLRMHLELDSDGTQAARGRVSALRADLVVEDDGEDFAL